MKHQEFLYFSQNICLWTISSLRRSHRCLLLSRIAWWSNFLCILNQPCIRMTFCSERRRNIQMYSKQRHLTRWSMDINSFFSIIFYTISLLLNYKEKIYGLQYMMKIKYCSSRESRLSYRVCIHAQEILF